MRDIRIYDFEFNLLGVMTDVLSVQWHIKYNGVGTFEGHFRLNDNISDLIMHNEYIVITQGDLQAICTGKMASDELVVCGRTVNWILSKRVRPPFRAKSIFGEYTDPETMLLYCLKKGFTEPPKINDDGEEDEKLIDENRIVDNFVLPKPQGAEKFDYHFWRLNAHDIESLTVDLCKKMNRGHKVQFDIDNKKWAFEFIYPNENKLVFAKELKNMYDASFSEDIQYKSDGGWYCEGETNDDENDNAWHYIGSSNKKGIYLWDSVLDGTGVSEAESVLDRKNNITDIKGKMISYRYGYDYSLGDIVTVFIRFGNYEKEVKCMICGVDIQYSAGQSYEEPVFEEI